MPAIAWASVILFGFTMGGIVSLRPIFIGICFERVIIGKIIGLIVMFAYLSGGLIMPPLLGYIYDTTGSYNTALVMLGGLLLIPVIAAFLIRPLRKEAAVM